MKKVLGIVLTLSMTAAVFTEAFAAGGTKVAFSDISDEKYKWAKSYIEEMADEGYINGYADGTYKPDNEVTRLETIVLFARAMGAGREENKEAMEYAIEKYGDTVDNLKLNFGKEEIAFMLYRGVLSENDLSTYLSSNKANKAMPRQEAAAIITKALCGEETAKAEVLTDMEYTDTKLIDPDYTQYVFYVSEMGIMNGMDDGSFSPDSSVLRSQIAVMLHRAVNKINLYIESPYIKDIDYDKKNITIVDTEGGTDAVPYDKYTKFYMDGKLSDEDSFAADTTATLTYINERTAFIDMNKIVAENTYKAIYQGSTANSEGTVITFKETDSNKTMSYQLASKATLYNEDGSNAQLRNFALGSYVEFDVTNDKIIRMSVLKKDSYILQAVVESIDIEDDLYLTISHTDKQYDGLKFKLNDNIDVYKNNDREDLSKIYKGDRIDITMEYGVITKIKATSNNKIFEGVISEVNISSAPTIKVKINDEIQTFDVLTDTKITSSGEAATLYDLRVGDNVKITTESGVVLKIDTTVPVISSNPITGVVEIVNTSKGFIKVDGETIFCNDSSTTFITSNGSTQTMKNIKVGSTVSVRGSLQNGAYTAQLIIIEQ
ncbi:MAG: S-layer homology domain-containing protein [Clostridia bacterium]|nr:S-layer homology domain-containing protein [Clostridia bacterium]